MKVCKLYLHRKSYSDADLVLNPKDHTNANLGDIVEIIDREDDGERLLLQITKFSENKGQGRDSISIDENIAALFNLRAFTDVVVRVVNAADVALDSVEITFKDQYMGRSEMWRLKTFLTNTCVYSYKKIDYNDMQFRCQIYEMWAQGERVSCGAITEDTKIVFRSSTSMVYLFIQMSSEMWDFDMHGDLYFEKAVNGFLTELFYKWKKLGANHEVTIVLFSRTLYTAKSLEEFPYHMRDCLQQDYKGRYYEDFYRVAVQNERNDDWSTVLIQLRKLFTTYQSTVLRYHERNGTSVPQAVNSTAAQGNFLEVLNISLNAFEKHYLDRTFDRTGQLSIVISPGVGVFEVERELTNITKQRVIDNGVGSDLVCVGEQPLHAVPLLKFHNKDTTMTSADDYSLPHWINLSFYSTKKKLAHSNFIPRIKLPPNIANTMDKCRKKENVKNVLSCNQSEYFHNSLFDFDAYDDQIFMPPPAQGTCSFQRVVRAKKTSVPNLEFCIDQSSYLENFTPVGALSLSRKMSDPDIYHGSSAILVDFTRSFNASESIKTEKQPIRSIMPMAPVVRPGRALINPFDPSHVTVKLTSNRRRWTHIFPKGPTGVLIQQHHYQAIPAKSTATASNANGNNTFDSDGHIDSSNIDGDHTSICSSSLSKSFSSNHSGDKVEFLKRRTSSILNLTGQNNTTGNIAPTKSFLWGATGEQEWTPALTTGVDWKSLTIPACLPITTDYFPENRALHNDYLVSAYTLLPDAVNLDYAISRAVYRKPLSTEEVFHEIVSQRLAQGFQLILLEDKNVKFSDSTGLFSTQQISHHHQQQPKATSAVLNINKIIEEKKEYLLSIGRIFHKITLSGSVITVTAYRPRHPYPPINVHYRYRFQAPQHETYEISGVNFKTEKLENFNWNYMDHYICARGDVDYPLMESLKYRRYRMYMMPKENLAMNKIIEFGSTRCDIFADVILDNTQQQVEDFLRFVELHMNKLKRQISRKPRDSPSAQSHISRRRYSTSILSRNTANQHASAVNVAQKTLADSSTFSSSFNSNMSRPATKIDRARISPAADANSFVFKTVANIKFQPNATIAEIFEAMKHPITGVGFYEKTQSLPPGTFCSYDALLWLRARLDSEKNCLEILEEMRKEKLICHSSGDWKKPVIPGFYLYCITPQKNQQSLHDSNAKPLNDLIAFENEWMETEIQGCSHLWSNEPSPLNVPNFLKDTMTPHSWKDYSMNKRTYRHSHLEMDVNQKSDRMEWGHVKYHTVMQPGYAYEIVVEWVTSSGPIVYDCLHGWSRKAHSLDYQLVPVPADPMAEPFTEKSDPLRGPIFIPLATNFTSTSTSIASLFEDYEEETKAERMLLFQESILARYGFMPCIVDKNYSNHHHHQVPKEYQYVHCSGNIFVLIRCFQNDMNLIESPSSKEANVTRCVYGHTNTTNVPRKVGFLWAWNHMIPNKKWKSLLITGFDENELFQIKLLKDFRLFCSNSDHRLADFWYQCKELKMKQTSQKLKG